MAYLMAAAAILEIAQELPGSLSLANKMMQQCKKTNDAICNKQTREANIPSSRADKSVVFMLMMVSSFGPSHVYGLLHCSLRAQRHVLLSN